jgi:hypothetical protein
MLLCIWCCLQNFSYSQMLLVHFGIFGRNRLPKLEHILLQSVAMLKFSLLFCGRLYRWQILRIIKRHVSRERGLRTRHLCKCLQHRRSFSVPPQSMVLRYTSLKSFKVTLSHVLSTTFNCKFYVFSNLSGISKTSPEVFYKGLCLYERSGCRHLWVPAELQ